MLSARLIRAHLLSVCCAVPRCAVPCFDSGELKAPWSGKSVAKPVITVIDESGNKAGVVLYNIWAGKVRCTRAWWCNKQQRWW